MDVSRHAWHALRERHLDTDGLGSRRHQRSVPEKLQKARSCYFC